jgi:hypothetical protein
LGADEVVRDIVEQVEDGVEKPLELVRETRHSMEVILAGRKRLARIVTRVKREIPDGDEEK